MKAEDAVDLDLTTERFVMKRRIGEGAFGVVWEAYDRERQARVALKSLMRADPGALLLFKREFRALADIVHPNLVTLYELLSSSDRWFFTMEFVDGRDFIAYVTHSRVELGPANERAPSSGLSSSGPAARVQGQAAAMSGATSASSEWYEQPTLLDAPNLEDTFVDDDPDPTRRVRIRTAQGDLGGEERFDVGRLREALRQLAAGLDALHETGKLHRDIKPSNVLITREGRVVILDFGLITELSPAGVEARGGAIVGTPVFMSPEQGKGEPLTPASDWYAVGVMLYAALTGHVPFDGPPMHVLMSKAEVDPIAPGKIVPGIPPDLDALCVDLLRREPRLRPSGADVLRRLGEGGASAEVGSTAAPPTWRAPLFVGRERHVHALVEAFERSRRGALTAALVYGRSGMGKSSLVRSALEAIKAKRAGAVILTGRCYQRESVPYKALDSLVDELSVYLQALPAAEVAALMPGGVDALARLFPVLRQLDLGARAAAKATPIADPQELRRRAFGALRELFARLAAKQLLVLFIDDLQWGDADSDALLAELVRPPDAPPLLLIASYRSEELRASSPSGSALDTPLAQALRAARAPIEAREVTVDIEVAELTLDESTRLAAALLGSSEADKAEAIAREARGNPLFIDALARHALFEIDEAASSKPPRSGPRATDPTSRRSSLPPDTDAPRVNLAKMINARVAKLPSGARRLLEIVVVAGRPIDAALARRAAGVDSHEQAVLSLLQVSHLVRASALSTERAAAPWREIEVYHDRIRDSVLASVNPDDLKAYHNRLAITLELDGRADPERLAAHYEAADRPTKAAHYALKAADDAFDALAFDRAARLYERAIPLLSSPSAAAQVRLAESLANAGRGAQAADAYLAAIPLSAPEDELDLRRRAAEQLLISGHFDRGLSTLRPVLDSLGMKLPGSSKGAIVSLLARRARLWIRGLRFKERRQDEVPPDALMKIDACWAVAIGLSFVDNILGSDFQARHLLLALEAGEPYRIARALAVEIAYSASGGPKNQARTDDLIRVTQELSERIENPHALALATTMRGAALYLAGRWREGLELTERGAAMLRERCRGVTWELDTADMFILNELNMLGRWRALAARHREVVDGANARGDLYAEVHSALDTGWIPPLSMDDPAGARRVLDEAIARCTHQEGFQFQHGLHLMGHAAIHVYCNTPVEAWNLFESRWKDIKGAFMLEVPMAHMFIIDLRARSAVASASQEGATPAKKRAWIAAARRDARRLISERLGWTIAMGTLINAGAATLEGGEGGDRGAALRGVTEAEAAFTEADMAAHAAVTRRRRGALVGGDEGLGLIESADRALAELGIMAPERVAAMLAPGRWPQEER